MSDYTAVAEPLDAYSGDPVVFSPTLTIPEFAPDYFGYRIEISGHRVDRPVVYVDQAPDPIFELDAQQTNELVTMLAATASFTSTVDLAEDASVGSYVVLAMSVDEDSEELVEDMVAYGGVIMRYSSAYPTRGVNVQYLPDGRCC